jgi:hypothetical protein
MEILQEEEDFLERDDKEEEQKEEKVKIDGILLYIIIRIIKRDLTIGRLENNLNAYTSLEILMFISTYAVQIHKLKNVIITFLKNQGKLFETSVTEELVKEFIYDYISYSIN